MINWLDNWRKLACFFESRILVAAHRFIRDVDRFDSLSQRKTALTGLMRRSILRYYAHERYVWGKLVVDKEPLEPIALPDEDYGEFLRSVRAMFPECRLFFMVRDPVETIWSMVSREWGYSLARQALVRMPLDSCIKTWNANAALALEYANDRRSYLCQFETLIREPTQESRRIWRFLGIDEGSPFVARETKAVGFSAVDRERIMEQTRGPRLELSRLQARS